MVLMTIRWLFFDSFVRVSHAEAKYISSKCVSLRAVGEHAMKTTNLLSVYGIFLLLNNCDNKPNVELIPNGIKGNVYFLVAEKRNIMRSEIGQTKRYPDD